MNTASIDLTLRRIEQIEHRFSNLFGPEKTNSFDNVLKEQIQESNSLETKNVLSGNKNIEALIGEYSKKNNLDENLVKAVIKTESNFNVQARSSAGALGLMQLMPQTAKSLGVNNPLDPEQNISGGTKYLKNMIDKYDSVELGLAAYNAGPGNVNKYGGVPPFDETQNYVKKVIKTTENLKGHGG